MKEKVLGGNVCRSVLRCLKVEMEGMSDLFGLGLASRARVSTRWKFWATKGEDFCYTSNILGSFWKPLSLPPSPLALSSAAQVSRWGSGWGVPLALWWYSCRLTTLSAWHPPGGGPLPDLHGWGLLTSQPLPLPLLPPSSGFDRMSRKDLLQTTEVSSCAGGVG